MLRLNIEQIRATDECPRKYASLRLFKMNLAIHQIQIYGFKETDSDCLNNVSRELCLQLLLLLKPEKV